MRWLLGLLSCTLLASAEGPDVQERLAAALGACPSVKWAQVKGEMQFFALGSEEGVCQAFEGELQDFQVTHLKVTVGAKGTEIWSQNLHRAVSTDGKTWTEGTSEEWLPYLAPEDLVVLLTQNAAGVEPGGLERIGGARCQVARVYLTPDGARQVLARLGTQEAHLDAKSLQVSMAASIGEEDGLLYGIELSVSALGMLAPGQTDPETPEGTEPGEGSEFENGAHHADAQVRRGQVSYRISFEITKHAATGGLTIPPGARPLLGH